MNIADDLPFLLPGHGAGRWPRVVLGDFGCAVTREDVQTGKTARDSIPCGTQGWFPPEIIEGITGGWSGNYGKPTDVWQMGAVIQCMTTTDPMPNQRLVDSGVPCSRNYSKELNHVVMEIMGKNDDHRPSAVDVAEMVVREIGKAGL